MTDAELTAHLHVLQDFVFALAMEVPADRLAGRLAALAEASRTHFLQSSLPDAARERYDALLQQMCEALALPYPK